MKYKVSMKKINKAFCYEGIGFINRKVLKDKRVIKDKRSIIISKRLLLSYFKQFLEEEGRGLENRGIELYANSFPILKILADEDIWLNRCSIFRDYYYCLTGSEIENAVEALKYFLNNPGGLK